MSQAADTTRRRRATALGLIIAAFLWGFRQLSDPAFRGVMVRSVLLSIVVFAALAVFIWWVLDGWGLFDGLVGWLFDFVSWSLYVIITWALFPTIVTLFVAIFLDDIVDAVLRHHYQDEPLPDRLGLWGALVIASRFTVLLVLLNLGALFLYIFFLWVPFINVFIFYGLNGYLLSREYFDLVALRHYDDGQAARLRRKNAGKLFLAGIAIAFLLTIPIVNWIAPLVGIAAMVHVFKGLPKPVEVATAR
tara:strand:+ start:1596 stop:2339 length:744 start_codon:yes stop_codon:yes gene_type:complete